MREPYVFPMDESPFSPDVPHDEAEATDHRRRAPT